MIVRKLNFLVPPGGYRKVETVIHDDKLISAVYLKDKGYCLFINNKEDEMYLINTNLSPEDFKLEENLDKKQDFINLVKTLLDQIYVGVDIPEYEKQHHEFVFLKIIDLFGTDVVEIIDEDSDLYKTIELGFIKFDIDLLNMDVNNEPTIKSSNKNSLDSSVKNFKERFL